MGNRSPLGPGNAPFSPPGLAVGHVPHDKVDESKILNTCRVEGRFLCSATLFWFA